MRGKYFLNIKNKHVDFYLELERQVTIVKDNSSTGKSYFASILEDYFSAVKNKAIPDSKLATDFKSVHVITDSNYSALKDTLQESLIVMDEQYSLVNTKEFSDFIKGSNNYFLLIARGTLSNIPYSVHSIYRFESTRQFENGRVYTSTVLKRSYPST